jgi:hypothetical protein
MTDKEYIICQCYYLNHIKKKLKITDWCNYYSDILYGDGKRNRISIITFEPIYWKRLYNKYQKEFIDRYEDDLSYCEMRLLIDKNKKENNANN